MFAVLIYLPWLAAIPAAGFYWLYRRFKSRLALIASLLWAVYLIYEVGNWLGILCDADCNIRVDLLVIYPLLAAVSLLAFVRVLIGIFRRKS